MEAPRLRAEAKRPTPEHYRILAMAWAGWTFDFYDLVLYSFLLAPLGRELRLSRVELSLAYGASLAATALGGIAFGWLADRAGRRAVLQATIAIYSVGTLLSGLSWSLPSLLLFRVVTGIGVGGEWATGQAYVSETFRPESRGRYAALVQTGAPFGVALAAVVGGLLEPSLGWRGCFVVSGLPALLVFLFRRALPESDMWLARRTASAASSGAVLFAREHRGTLARALVLTIFAMSSYWLVYTWLPGYLAEERHFSLAKSAAWILVMQAGGLLGYASFGFAADRWGRRPSLAAYSLAFAAGLLPATLFWDRAAAHPALLLAAMFVVGVGTGIWSGFGPLLSELFPTAIRNTAMGGIYNLARGIQFLAPLAVALVARRHGLSGGIALAALFAVGQALWVWTLPETRGRRLS